MRLGVKFSLTNIVIVVSLSILLELASFLVFSKAIHSLEKKLFNEQVERLLLLAFEQDELIFEGLYNDEKNAQMRVVDKFRIIYRKQKNNVTFPFIIDTNGKVIAHPESEKDIQMFDKDSLTFMNNQKEGELEYSYNGIRKWCVFKTFKPWNWIFCMTTSMYKKNEAIIPFISTALIISLVFIVLSIFAVLFVSH
jgi:hypothetical protein